MALSQRWPAIRSTEVKPLPISEAAVSAEYPAAGVVA